MKIKAIILLLAGSLLVLAAWLVHVPGNAQPNAEDGVPKKYRETVSKGLEYLAKQQHKDGHWEGDEGKHPVAMTALVGMALLMEGSTIEKGKYSANIRKAAEWLISKSDPKRDGLIFSNHPSETDRYMYGHGLATQFISWTYGKRTHDQETAEKVIKILTQATKYIAKAQSTRGGWYRTSSVEGHDLDEVLASTIQIQSLTVAGDMGIRWPTDAETAHDYLKLTLAKQKKDVTADQKLDAAAALACRSGHKNDDVCQKWFKRCQAEIPVGAKIKWGRDELTHYYYAQAVFNDALNAVRDNGATWTPYRTAMFDHLQNGQRKDGSWPASDGIGVGPLYSTAIWCTVLQLDTRRHPLTRERGLVTF